MRRISIRTTDAGIIELFDDSEEPMDSYCSELSKIMKMSNIVTIQTSESSVIVRPSKITGIQVKELFEEEPQQEFSDDIVFQDDVVVETQEEKQEEQAEEIIEKEKEETEKIDQPEATPPNPDENQEQKDNTEDIITDVD